MGPGQTRYLPKLGPMDDGHLVAFAVGLAIVGIKVDGDHARRVHRLSVDVVDARRTGPILGGSLSKRKVIVPRIVFAWVAGRVREPFVAVALYFHPHAVQRVAAGIPDDAQLGDGRPAAVGRNGALPEKLARELGTAG
jgi:hypothetical protein